MKKIINGKKYDTATAKIIGQWDNGLGYGELRYCEEQLYKKKTNEFFLYGCGGAMSKYSKALGDASTGSSEIIPLTEQEARKWAEDNLDGDTYEDIFGEVEE